MTDISFDIVTSTDFIDYGDYVYAAVVNGSYFILEHSPEDKSLCLRMSFFKASNEAREALSKRMLSSQQLREDQLVLSDHAVSIRMVLREGWQIRLKDALQFLSSWANDSRIESGCFLCGENNPSVFFRDQHSMFLCDTCDNSLKQQAAQKKQSIKAAELADTKREPLVFGLLVSSVARLIISIIWIPIAVTTLKLSIRSSYFEDTFAFAVIFSVISMFTMIRMYKKATGNLSIAGYVSASIIHIAFSFIDMLLIMFMVLQVMSGSHGTEYVADPLGWISRLNYYMSIEMPSVTSFFFSALFIGIILHSLTFFIRTILTAFSKNYIPQDWR